MKKTLLIITVCILVMLSILTLCSCKKDAELIGNYFYSKQDGDVTLYDTLSLREDGIFVMRCYQVNNSLLTADVKIADILDTLSLQKEIVGSYEGNDTTLKLTPADGNKPFKVKLYETGKFMQKTSVPEGLILALVGIAITFLVLAFLMGVIILTGYIYKKVKDKKAPKVEQTEQLQPATSVRYATGSCGELAIYDDISDRDCALIMAIVADTIQEPINTLRFISIKEVKEEDKQ